MEKIIHRSEERGHANHGWLDSHHSFSFASYYDPKKTHFGMLRVLNDDIVAPGRGFGAHPHENMEIISIPLKGALEHKDNTGTKAVIKENDVQIMSAGTGIMHSEYNHSDIHDVNFLQIWVFPKEDNISPRYDQKQFNPEDRINKIQTVVSPDKNDDAIWINQDAWFGLANFRSGFDEDYRVHKEGQGIYIFVLEGEIKVAGEVLKRRDAAGIWDTQELNLTANKDSEVLLMEVPMNG